MGKVKTDEENIIDIDLSVTRKKKFRINGDNTRFLELNTSDLGIFSRLKAVYPKMKESSAQAAQLLESNIEDTEDEDGLRAIEQLAKLSEIDAQLRNQLDEIFDSNVSEVCAPDGTLYDPFNGAFRFEHIIDVLTGLYETNLQQEFRAMTQRVEKHTKKYTK